jgi:hypothetical protein
MSDATSTPGPLAKLGIDRLTVLWGALLVCLELLSVLLYVQLPSVIPTEPLFFLYPFVWINLGLWAVLRTDVPDAAGPQRQAALLVAGGYLLVVAWFGGLLVPAGGADYGLQVSLADQPPGWGPTLTADFGLVAAYLVPYRLVGYVALSYLVYATVLDVVDAGVAVGGLLGVASCVSCSWPVLAVVVTGVAGAGASGVVISNAYAISTAVFAVTVVLLTFRPGFDRAK